MVWRRMRVTRKTGGKGSVSYTITIPEEIYQAMGRPGEVLVTYNNGVMLVKPARGTLVASSPPRDPRVHTILDALDSHMDKPRLLLDTIVRRLEEDNPRIIAVDCMHGTIAYEAGGEIEVAGFEPGLCSDLATLLAILLAVDPEELATILAGRRRILMEITPNKVVVYPL